MDHSPYISRIMLGRKLKEYRLRANNMSVAEAARRFDISDSKLRKLEAGTNESIKQGVAHSASYVYRLDAEESLHLINLCEAADKHGWYHDFDVAQEFKQFLEMEGAASGLRIMQQSLVYGLFQTEEYLEGLKAYLPGARDEYDQGLRLERQEAVLDLDDPPEIVYISDEAALRRVVGDPTIMQAQYRHLLELNERDNIEILVLPFAAGYYPSVLGPYQIMHFTDGVFPTTVYLESLHGSHYEDAGKIVGRYEGAFDHTRQAPPAVPIKEFIDGSNLLA